MVPPIGRKWQLIYPNRAAGIRQQCRKTIVLSCHRCLINIGVEKMNKILHLNFDHHMSLSKSKCWYLNNCFHFLKRAAPFFKHNENIKVLSLIEYSRTFSKKE